MPVLDDEKTPATTYVTNDMPIDTPDRTHGDLERKLVRKLDLRMSITMVIYTLNLVSLSCVSDVNWQDVLTVHPFRLTGRMLRAWCIAILNLTS